MKRILLIPFLFALLSIQLFSYEEFIDPNPSTGNDFGANVTVLPNGNVVITSPYTDINGVKDCGAVYLYNGKTHKLISSLYGSSASDMIGSWNIVVLTNGNYVIQSPYWDNGSATDAGAVTWGNAYTGVSGIVSANNSLAGTSSDDGVGSIVCLTNGNYVVLTPSWDNGLNANVGAVTWGNGASGAKGVISSANSLIGSSPNDRVGDFTSNPTLWKGVNNVIALNNGNYVVASYKWDNGSIKDAGAVTFCEGTTGLSGVINSENSLVGTSDEDALGSGGVTALPNSNYVVCSPYWSNGAVKNVGAVTLCNGSTGRHGEICIQNSLIGDKENDNVGSFWDYHLKYNGITILNNSNYLVTSWRWHNSYGAVTFCNGQTGCVGEITEANSLIGTSMGESSTKGIEVLPNGDYFVISPMWNYHNYNLNSKYGAITWCNGTTGLTGVVSPANSLVNTGGECEITVLTNDNYVVFSPGWDNGSAENAGAITWCNSANGLSGEISAANSLVGSSFYELSSSKIIPLPNGNYVVNTPYWSKDTILAVGAVTWCDGTKGLIGAFNSSNSLIGSNERDAIGKEGITTLTNGNYVIISPYWDNDTITDAGAVTWCDGTKGLIGTINASNSLIGSSEHDEIGSMNVFPLTNGNYVINSPIWDNNGDIENAGAVTWADGTKGIYGVIDSTNSFIGTADGSVGSSGIIRLNNGNYVVRSGNWGNGDIEGAGAVTWCNGATGRNGTVNESNSLIGSHRWDMLGYRDWEDYMGYFGAISLKDGNFIVSTPEWDNGDVMDAGAVTWCNGTTGLTGKIDSTNSIIGHCANSGLTGIVTNDVRSEIYVRFLPDSASGKVYIMYYGGMKPDSTSSDSIPEYQGKELSFSAEYPYPNPVNNTFAIKLKLIEDGNITVQICDVTGRVIQNLFSDELFIGIHNLTFDISSIRSGAYHLVISKDGESLSFPIQIVR